MTTDRNAAAEFGCRYRPAYANGCGALAGESGFCANHVGKKCCVCGDQAANECNHTGQFVCGAPLCGDCEGWVDTSKAGGSWGFMNHSHRVKPAVQSARDRRPMVEGDLRTPSPNPESYLHHG